MYKRTKVILGIILFFIVLIALMIPKLKSYLLEEQQERFIEQAMGLASGYLEDYIESDDEYLLKMIACELHLCERMLSESGDGADITIVNGVKNILLAEKEELLEVHYLEKGLVLLSGNASSKAGYGMLLSFFNVNN